MGPLNIVRVTGLSVLSMTLASCILGGLLGGVWGFFGGPFLMLFGWFYLPLIVGLHFAAWYLEPVFQRGPLGSLTFPISGALFAACLFAVIGVKEQGQAWRFTFAYMAAAGIAGCLSCVVIRHFHEDCTRKYRTE